MKTEAKKMRGDLGRMTDEEYAELLKSNPPHEFRKPSLKRPNLGRLTDEEYKRLWNGNPPKERN